MGWRLLRARRGNSFDLEAEIDDLDSKINADGTEAKKLFAYIHLPIFPPFWFTVRGLGGAAIRAAMTLLQSTKGRFEGIDFMLADAARIDDTRFIDEFKKDVTALDDLFARYGFFKKDCAADLASLSKNLSDLTLDSSTRMSKDTVTLEFACGKSHETLFSQLKRTIGPAPINEELVEQLFSLLKIKDNENCTNESVDAAMRFKVNVLSELRAERQQMIERASSEQAVFKVRHTHTLGQVVKATEQMLEEAKKYTPEKMTGVPG